MEPDAHQNGCIWASATRVVQALHVEGLTSAGLEVATNLRNLEPISCSTFGNRRMTASGQADHLSCGLIPLTKSLSSQGSTVLTWARRTRQTRQTEPTTAPMMFACRLSPADPTHTRTIGSGGQLTCPVSLSHVSRAVQSLLLYPEADTPSVQADGRDDLFDRHNQFVMGGNHRGTRRTGGTTTTTFSAGGGYHHSHSYSETWSSTTTTDVAAHPHGEPLTKQLLRYWLAPSHTFLLTTMLSLTHAIG